MILFMVALQAAATPDIELNARVTADRVEVRESRGVSLSVRAQPDAGSQVRVDNPMRGRTGVLRNVDIRVRAEARLATGPATGPATPNNPQQ